MRPRPATRYSLPGARSPRRRPDRVGAWRLYAMTLYFLTGHCRMAAPFVAQRAK